MIIRLLVRIGVGLILVAAVLGCAGPLPAGGTQPIYDSYVAQFNLEQRPQTTMITRPDGHRIHARQFGLEHQGRSPTLVMMHGFPDNQHLYDALIPELADRFHVVTFDFLGSGQSEKPAAHVYDVSSQRTDLESVVKALGLNRIVPVVHDLSGQAGIDWALDNESQTVALVLLNTYYSPMVSLVAPEAIQFYSTPGVLRDIMVWGSMKSGGNFQNGVASQLAKFFSNDVARDKYLPIVTHGASDIRPAFFSSTALLWPELEARRVSGPRLQQFKKPVHIVFGADDPYLNTGVAAEFTDLFPAGALHLISGAGHYVQLDAPQRVGRILRESL